MCGIVGFSGARNDAVLNRMANCLMHRGPDGDGFYQDEAMQLGMRRLAVVDIETGKQPIYNETQEIVVVQNGEIYNHREIRARLQQEGGHRFYTDHSDTEVIPHLYETYGEEWVSQVNGMFAVAIWDKKAQKLLLYRDRIGKKPLYYSFKNGRLVFGSEIKALLEHPWVSKNLNYASLYHYFSLKHISAPETAYQDIKQLMPGEYLVFENETIRLKKYWLINFRPLETSVGEAEAASKIFNIFQDAVKIRMDCDAPYGAYLSGGVDSSAVVSLMTRFASKPIKTFCLGYKDLETMKSPGKIDDLKFARTMATRLGTEHHEYVLGSEEFAVRMPDVLKSFDEPFSGTISTFFLSTLIRQHVKVALSGDGADELYGSYLAHRLANPIQQYFELSRIRKKSLRELTSEEKARLKPFDDEKGYEFLVKTAHEDLATWRNRLTVFSPAEITSLFTRGFKEKIRNVKTDLYGGYAKHLTAQDPLNRVLEIDQQELLPNEVLPFVDRLSMAHSIEVRVPYLDYRLIEYVNRLPGKFKIRDGINKYIHRKVMRELLPEDLLNRPKEGFVQPIYYWMHAQLKDWTLHWLKELPADLFNGEQVKKITELFASGTQELNAKIWNLVCFSIWWHTRS